MSDVRIVGVLNVTPDSFSDGGRYADVESAISRGLELTRDGAAIVDVGGESTRPGAARVPERVEQQRVIPVVSELAARGVTVSIDTMNASTATAAVAAGATFVNDVSAGRADADMLAAVAATDARFIASHWRGPSATMDDLAHYDDVVSSVRADLAERVDAAIDAGIARERLVVDPGLGFAKHSSHNWALLASLRELVADGVPVLVGASRKRFLGALESVRAAESGAAEAAGSASARDVATAVVSVLAADAGVWGVRVHDVAATSIALETARAWRHGGAA